MTKMYRSNAFAPRDFFLHYVMQEAATLFQSVDIDFSLLTSDEYHEWVGIWKQNYAVLSSQIRTLKDQGYHREAQQIARLANTLLNARQYAKDVRRNIATEEFNLKTNAENVITAVA